MENDLNRRTNLSRGNGMSSAWMWALAAIVVFGLLFMWAPWSNNRTANNTSPGTTVGSSTTTRPATPASPAAPAPTGPSSTR